MNGEPQSLSDANQISPVFRQCVCKTASTKFLHCFPDCTAVALNKLQNISIKVTFEVKMVVNEQYFPIFHFLYILCVLCFLLSFFFNIFCFYFSLCFHLLFLSITLEMLCNGSHFIFLLSFTLTHILFFSFLLSIINVIVLLLVLVVVVIVVILVVLSLSTFHPLKHLSLSMSSNHKH